MKVRYLMTPFLVSKSFWVISMGWPGLYTALRTRSDFRSVIYFPQKPEIPFSGDIPWTGDKITKDAYHDAISIHSPQSLDADVLIVQICNRIDDQIQLLRDLVPLNRDKKFVFLWSDKFGPLEKSILPVIEELFPDRNYQHWTHWGVQSFPKHICVDYCHAQELELPIHSEKPYDFGFNGYFALKKNHKWVRRALDMSSGRVSIIGGVDRDFTYLPQAQKSRLQVHGVITSWDEAWPIMSQSWIHLNSHKMQHIPAESIVRKFTMCAEAGTLCLNDLDEPVTPKVYPYYCYNTPGVVKKILSMSIEDRLEFLHLQREYSRQAFDPYHRVDVLLEMLERNIYPDYYSFREFKYRRV